MDSETARQGSPPTIPPAALEAISAPRSADSPRRCFICLTDQEPDDPPSSWVDPCPCTLEAHQDCMLAWVTDCERNNKPLQCPVCKSKITLEGPWDPIVALSDAVSKKFTQASPFVLFTSVSTGVQFSLQMYGALAMWTFSGREALVHYMLGRDMMGNGGVGIRLARERLGNALVLMNVGPTLLLGQVTPWFGNKIFLPVASLYGVYHVMHDDDFLSWPPSPQLAMTLFPYVRSMYYNLWKEFVFPTEVNLNRRIMGLPPLEEAENQGANGERGGQRNGEGGVIGFLQGLLDALDPDEDEQGGDGPRHIHIDGHGGAGQDGVMVEVVIEDFNEDEVDEQEINEELAQLERELGGEVVVDARIVMQEQEQEQEGQQPADGYAEEPQGQNAEPREDAAVAAPAPVVQPAGQQNHEVPQAPPVRRPGLNLILHGVSNTIVSALILPGISYAMGELLRFAMPKAWSALPPRNMWSRFSLQRPGIFQQQWGRSLIGGCLYIVLKDALRLYTKYRKVSNMNIRRVKNVERRRGNQ